MKTIVVVLVGLVVVACVACDAPVLKDDNQSREAARLISFVKEPRSGLCFAMLGSTGYYGFVTTSISAIPCTGMEK